MSSSTVGIERTKTDGLYSCSPNPWRTHALVDTLRSLNYHDLQLHAGDMGIVIILLVENRRLVEKLWVPSTKGWPADSGLARGSRRNENPWPKQAASHRPTSDVFSSPSSHNLLLLASSTNLLPHQLYQQTLLLSRLFFATTPQNSCGHKYAIYPKLSLCHSKTAPNIRSGRSIRRFVLPQIEAFSSIGMRFNTRARCSR